MGHRRIAVPTWAGLLCFALLLGACQQLITEYSVDAYKNATSLKAETLALVDKSGEKYSKHKDEVEALAIKISAAYEFANGLPNNELSAQQWRIMRDPNRNLYGGFVELWKKGPLQPAFREDVKTNIGRGYDLIICLEINKKETQRCTGASTSRT